MAMSLLMHDFFNKLKEVVKEEAEIEAEGMHLIFPLKTTQAMQTPASSRHRIGQYRRQNIDCSAQAWFARESISVVTLLD